MAAQEVAAVSGRVIVLGSINTDFVVSADRLHAIVPVDGDYEIRSMRIAR